MNIVIAREETPETRVALTPSLVPSYKKMKCSITVIDNAGKSAGFYNEAYQSNDAIVEKKDQALNKADVLLTVNPCNMHDLKILKPNAVVISQLNNEDSDFIDACASNTISLLNMNAIPRISRAQNMDALSSQANLAGYKAVLLAVNEYQRAVPMMMTAAGMIHPAKVLVLGAGVAGLQAIATARRLGAEVFAFDVRGAAREQVESLGAEFIEVSDENLESTEGYAQQSSEEYQQKQGRLIEECAQKCDIIISTALIPNRPAPILLRTNAVEKMKSGSIIVDLATARGGNCELSVKDKVVRKNGITIIGYSNLAGMIAKTASELYANNLLQIIKLLLDNGSNTIQFNPEDPIIQNIVACHQGKLCPFLKEESKT